MSKHTPGPWKVNHGKRGFLGQDESEMKPYTLVEVDHHGNCPHARICEMSERDMDQRAGIGGPYTMTDPEANALLIATAPELLDALERIVASAVLVPCKKGGRDAEHGEGMDGGKWRIESAVDGWIVAARAAVEKAKGGAV